MENQNDNKVKCPFCGYEMEKGTKRCENCASIIGKESNNPFDVSENIDNHDNLNFENSETSEELNGKVDIKFEDQTIYKVNEGAKAEQNQQKYTPYENVYKMNNLIQPAPKALTNGIKVALTALCVLVPIFGQFLGLILSIVFMNSDDELKECDDRRSFGLALLIACVIAFIVSVFWGFVILVAVSRTI